jgi:hypothetical protein
MPCRAAAKAKLAAMVLLPTPPFALLTAMTFLTFSMARFSGRPEKLVNECSAVCLRPSSKLHTSFHPSRQVRRRARPGQTQGVFMAASF